MPQVQFSKVELKTISRNTTGIKSWNLASLQSDWQRSVPSVGSQWVRLTSWTCRGTVRAAVARRASQNGMQSYLLNNESR